MHSFSVSLPSHSELHTIGSLLHWDGVQDTRANPSVHDLCGGMLCGSPLQYSGTFQTRSWLNWGLTLR